MRTAKLSPILLAAILVAGSAEAQRPPARPGGAQQEQAAPPPEIQLIYEREVFQYGAEQRRDPFRPLLEDADQGPRFEELTLQAIIYSNVSERSMAMLMDRGGRRFRVRRGDLVGNARVLDIGPLRVVFAVDNFGIVRQEMLELKARESEPARQRPRVGRRPSPGRSVRPEKREGAEG